MSKDKHSCWGCGEAVDSRRWERGYRTCLVCGEKEARRVKHTIVPMPKSNYIVVSDVSLLVGLNSSHKGGVK
jgi:ribosomal protein L37AE/L43A